MFPSIMYEIHRPWRKQCYFLVCTSIKATRWPNSGVSVLWGCETLGPYCINLLTSVSFLTLHRPFSFSHCPCCAWCDNNHSRKQTLYFCFIGEETETERGSDLSKVNLSKDSQSLGVENIWCSFVAWWLSVFDTRFLVSLRELPNSSA